jgi:DNA-binding NarL/FixJ family response regulator
MQESNGLSLTIPSRKSGLTLWEPRCDHVKINGVGISVMIIDDHAPFRASARTLLELEGYEVVGEAADGTSGLALADALQPELVLLDVALPDLSGFDVAERLAGSSRAAVVLVSSRDPSDFGARLRRTPALGFIPKDQLTGEAIAALLKDAA